MKYLSETKTVHCGKHLLLQGSGSGKAGGLIA